MLGKLLKLHTGRQGGVAEGLTQEHNMIQFTRQQMALPWPLWMRVERTGWDGRISAASDVVGVEQRGPFRPQKNSNPEREATIARGSVVYQDLQTLPHPQKKSGVTLRGQPGGGPGAS